MASAVGHRLIPLRERENWRAALLSNLLTRKVKDNAEVLAYRDRFLAGQIGTVEGSRRFVRELLEAPPDPELQEAATDLERVARCLVEQLPWEFADAAVFVLCGLPPWIDPIRVWTEARDFPCCNDGRVVLEIAPWVSDETVAAAFRSLRSMLVGRSNRGLSERAEAVLRFVMQEIEHWPPAADDWPVLFEAWQRTLGERFPYANHYKLKQAYQHAEARLLRSSFAFPWPPRLPHPHGVPRRVRYQNPDWSPTHPAEAKA